MTNSPGASVGPDDTTLVLSRRFEAPRDLVFRAWTENEHLLKWLCPKGFTVLFGTGDLRPGGAWRSGMRSPAGKDYVVRGVYRTIDPPERLSFTHAWENEQGQPGRETLVTVEFAEQAGQTVLHFEQSGFASKESRDGHAVGWSESFDNLADYLRGLLEGEKP